MLLLRLGLPFVDWANTAAPTPTDRITLVEVNEDSNAYFLEDEDQQRLRHWMVLNGLTLFEELLNDWYTDPDLLPQDRSLAMFEKWCDFDLHTLVLDTGWYMLEDDETDWEE